MAEYAGASAELNLTVATYAQPQNRFRYSGVVDAAPVSPDLFGEFVAGDGAHVPPKPENELAGRVTEEETIGYGWFGHVHLLPREPLAFGIILAQQVEEFELFNARSTAVSLNSIINNVGPDSGIDIPDLPTLPVELAPFTSLLDPTSTRLNPVRIEIVVAKEGSATIDGTLDFLFSNSQTLNLEISGTRLQLVTGIYEIDVQERLQFLTDIHEAMSGKEKRIALRSNPRQLFDVRYLLSDEERQRMDLLLFGAVGQPMALPLWHEDIYTTAAATAGATTLAVVGASLVDLREGGYAVIYESHTKFDVLSLSEVTDNQLTFTASPLSNSYSSRARIAPVRIVILRSAPTGSRYQTKVQEYALQFLVIDNDTGAMAGSTSGWNTYDGAVILDDCHGMAGQTVPVELLQRVRLIDSATGVARVMTRWPSSRRGTQRVFSMRNRGEIMKVRKLLIALNGPQKSFWQPTNHEDLTVVADLVAASSAMDIVNIGYFRNGLQKTGRNRIRITFTDGNSLEREITDSEELDPGTERLTVSPAWTDAKTVDEIRRVEFLEPTRFDADEFVIVYPRTGRAVLRAPTRMLL